MIKNRSLHLMLITRLAAVTCIVSLLVAILVVRNERERVFQKAREKALMRTGMLRMLILDNLDAPGLGNHAAMIRTLIKGAFLHDVGKIGIRDKILLKPGRLDEEEFTEMKKHVIHGIDIINRSSWLKDALPVVESHHEKFEGKGYPDGLIGTDIPILARIFAIADVFDALTSHRPYKAPLSFDETIDILKQGRTIHFDPEVLDVFISIAPPLYEIYGNRDDDRPRYDMDAIIRQYFKIDIAEFLE